MDNKREQAGRMLVVSNRLPFTVVEQEGKFSFKESGGGLVSGLKTYLESLRPSSSKGDYVWVGWPGSAVEGETAARLKEVAMSEFSAYPVFLSEDEMENFYHGFCNKIIWPLFHYFPSYAIYEGEYWNHYRKVNEVFCEALMEVVKPGDTVWIHDYHLMLLPRMIRDKLPDAQVGFFLHIPFPSFEVFRLLPAEWRRGILRGLLGADLIGFHTHDYAQYFLRCVLRILGFEHNMGQIVDGERIVKVGTFPMGIDFEKFNSATSRPEVRGEMENLKRGLHDVKVILSIDRLDYAKGIINRLMGYELFLESCPEWHRKVILNLVMTPSRIGVEHYQQTKRNVEELVGRINGKFGSLQWVPVVYQYQSFSFDSLAALYGVSDVALITPLRDGMNLNGSSTPASARPPPTSASSTTSSN
jgi:trehalose 6-phosphate synthase/phosphatase